MSPNSSRVFGSVIVLDRFGSGIKAIGFPRLLQRTSNSFSAEGTNADRESGIQRRGVETLFLGETLSWALPNAYRSISRNSPCTGLIQKHYDSGIAPKSSEIQ